MAPASRKRLCATLCLALATPIGGALADAATAAWPDFHGPGRRNTSPEHNLLQEWPEAGPPRLWTNPDCGEGYGGVVVAEGLVFTAGMRGADECLFALDLDGKHVWRTTNGRAWRNASPGTRASPVWADGRLFHMNAHGRLAAFKARTGRELWAVDLTERFKARTAIWGYAEHVVVLDDRVLCMPGGTEGRVVALDAESGETLWTNTDIRYPAAYCSPVVVTHAGMQQLLGLTQRSLVSVAVDSGKLLWSVPFVPRSPQNSLTPVFHAGHVFVAAGHRSGGALFRIAPDSRRAERVWYREDIDDCHSGAVLLNGRLYGAACRMGGKQFYCIDFLTGKTVHSDKTLGKVGLTCADGRIYCLGHRGTVSLLAPEADGFRIVSQFQLARTRTNTCLAHPVVADGRLYLRAGSQLHCFSIRAQP